MFHKIAVLKNSQNSQDGVLYVQYTQACNHAKEGLYCRYFLSILQQFLEQLFLHSVVRMFQTQSKLGIFKILKIGIEARFQLSLTYNNCVYETWHAKFALK